MSSFNRPPRPLAYPSYAPDDSFDPPADSGAERGLPSFYERIPEYDPAIHDGAFEAAETHSWIDLELVPSWLRPFTLDANTRFTRTPDHLLRPREPGATPLPPVLPQVPTPVTTQGSSRGWHFLFEPADDVVQPVAQPVAKLADIPEETAFAAPASAPEEVTAAPVVLPPVEEETAEAYEAPASEVALAEAAPGEEFLTETTAPVLLEADTAPQAVAEAASEVDTADVPDHLWSLLRLVVLGRAATPPAPAGEQDLDPAPAETVDAEDDLVKNEDTAFEALSDTEEAADFDEDEVLEAAASEEDELEDDELEDDAFEDEDSEDDEVAELDGDTDDAEEEGDEVDLSEDDDELDEDDAELSSELEEDDLEDDELEDDAFEDAELTEDEEDEEIDAELDEDEAEDAAALEDDDQADDEAEAEDEALPLAAAPILSGEAFASWRPYQQSISAQFFGALHSAATSAPATSAAVPAAVDAVAPVPVQAVATLPPDLAPAAAEGTEGPYFLPPLDLLREPPVVEPDYELSEEFLDQSSTMLQQVLRDFGVRGEVIDANPGPVVTLYEFEPAPGVKSSRVIGLSPDIARSMSAVSARVAVVEGRNVIGIELPNRRRETVWLRELLASHEFAEAHPKLGLCLGKTIGGVPVIADLARMPHLLVAGTTGSGKSVAINTMILSLLYRHTPEACRLIMIDPKMLELSVYEGIPHLLTPVVTDPKKAIIALKWAVKEMEERYRKMSRLAVRNIDGYNARVREAAARAEIITRNVQVGFDRETGEALFEEQEMDLTALPYIVVIVDEMADLMMVAGKEIEGAIQRLAQMARAAGIHLVMATQRPSVDVITGTIKANFPTRISFQVTSKIDSRTILGEMGAETLLGQGDMLFMAGGGRISRVHGPFVSDGEVEKVVAFLKAQGGPDYIDEVVLDEDAVAEDDDEAVFDRSGIADAGGDLYEQAVAIVMRDRKASTSYIQRRLQVGYNKAASLMERMETEGIVGPANHAGKREILTFSRPG
ncbi:DNA translocase FtsK [Xanthobacter aminoxidans]|uniref:DNA translocase FtsK n=1 Tax=Xanthobacter aminoxidans TaxID=186280 RepID=UPI002022C801|nr:DNA translocase FtsK [Xanthobacter aminoxidans]MCL8382729.1 FtsK/SpoIIIE domain-containing protein [Xanthobacter aminoxidans]